MKQFLNACFHRITKKRPGTILALGLLLSIVSIWIATGLKYDSRMDRLLPEDLPLVQEFHKVVEATGGSGPLVVVLEGLSQSDAPKVIQELTERLGEVQGTRYVDSRVPKQFLNNRQLLLASRQDLLKLEDLMKGAVGFARNQLGGFFGGGGGGELYNPADLQSLSDEYKLFEEINPYYKGKSQRRYFLFVQPEGSVTHTDFMKEYVGLIEEEIRTSALEERFAGLAIRLTGSMIPRLEENVIIVNDLKNAALLAAVLATSIIFFYTRSGFSIPLVIFPLLVSLTYTFALTRILIGHVNIISGFLVAILMGLGIDYGIHLYIRFKQELEKGHGITEAVELVVTQVGRSGIVAMMTTISVFSLLIVSDFKGFSEFGIIAAVGIVCAFISYYFFFPAQVLFYDRIHWLRKPRPRLFSMNIANLYSNTPYFLSALFILLMTASLFLLPNVAFEYDFQKLKGESPASDYETETTDDFGFAFSPTVILADSKDDLHQVHQALEKIKRKYGEEKTTIGLHHSLSLFTGKEYHSKKEVLERIQDLFEREQNIIEISLGSSRFEKLKLLVNAKPFEESKIPDVLVKRFTAGDKYLLLMFSPADKNFFDVRNIYQLNREIQDLKEIMKGKGIQISALNDNLLAAAVLDWVIEKGPLAMGLAMALVFVILIVDMRSLSLAIKTFLPLITGLALTGALMTLFHYKLNFINIVMLPSIVGIMIDHCIYLGHHILDYPGRETLKSLKETGSALILSALTTLAGYVSLNVAHHAGIRSIASVVQLGIITCTICALFMLPALFELGQHKFGYIKSRDRMKLKGGDPDAS